MADNPIDTQKLQARSKSASLAPPVDLARESVAGEEDPGAAMDLETPRATREPQPVTPMSPGDQAPAGTPGTGEDVCPDCGGSGRKGPSACPECQGTGKVTVGIGGG